MWLSTSFITFLHSVLFHLSGAGSTEKGRCTLWDEVHKLEMEAQHLESEGLEKMEMHQWQAQRQRVSMGI